MLHKTELFNLALRAAKAASSEILRYYNSSELQVEKKEDNSPLTNADIAANDAILFYLDNSGIPVCSEERLLKPSQMSLNDTFWLVDPLDGTKDFIKRNGEFCICIALIERGRPSFGLIYVPVSGEYFYTDSVFQAYNSTGLIHPEKCVNSVISGHSSHSISVNKICEHFGLERLHCGSAIKFCRVAQGLAGVYPRFCGSSLWDIAAGDAIIKASGGGMYSIESGEELTYSGEKLKNDYFIAFSRHAMHLKDQYLAYAKTLLNEAK